MTELLIDGDTFKVEVEGDSNKPTVLLSNALGTVLSLWDAQMPALLEHFRVIRYDARGHGGSAVGEIPYSVARLGRDVLAILDWLEIEQTHFIGMSMGGMVGQWLLVNAPHRLGRTVLANTAARIATAATWNERIKLVLSGGLEGNAKGAIERWFSPAFAARQPEVVATFHNMLRNASAKGYAASCAALRDADFRHALISVSSPVLVVTGADDPVTPAESVATMLAAMPDAKHVVLNARHVSAVEAAADFGKAVIGFLTSASVGKPARRRAGSSGSAPRAVGRGERRIVGGSSGARRPLTKAAASKKSAEKTGASKVRLATTPRKAKLPAKAATVKPTAHRDRGATTTRSTARTRVKAPSAATKAPAPRPAGPKTVAKRAAAAKPRTRQARARSSVGKKAPSKAASAKVTPARRAMPTASARIAKASTPKKTNVAKAKTTPRKVASKTTGTKLPTPRRKAPATPRRPKGRGKS